MPSQQLGARAAEKVKGEVEVHGFEHETGGSQGNLEGVAAMAAEAQPTGTTFETTSVHTKVQSLL